MNIFEKIARRITRLSWNKTVHHIMLEAEKRRIINSHQLHEILGAWNNECFPERGHASFLKAVEHSVQRIWGTVAQNDDLPNEKMCATCGHSESRHQTAGGFCKHCTCNEFVEPATTPNR